MRYPISRACWLSFVDWLGSGLAGVSPRTVRLVQQSAEALSPWLLSLLAERAGQPAPFPQDEGELAKLLMEDMQARPLTAAEAQRTTPWLGWLLEADQFRLPRLLEAPMRLFYRQGCLAWEARYWALVVSLVRLSQGYGVLERRQGREAAAQAWAEAAARVQQAGG